MSNLKVATYNLWKNDGEFPKRIEEIPNNLRKNQFDIICFQEDYCSSTFSSSKFINVELDYNYITTPTRVKLRNNKLSSSNLTILSKYKMKLLDEIYFKKTQEEERACQLVEFEFEDKKALLINTHLCHLSSTSRVFQIKTILKEIDKYKYDIAFFCGDLNALPLYNEINIIKENGFEDINKDFTHQEKVILDYIFYKSDLKLNIESKIMLKDFSDHYCLLNTFKF
ncbi:endonuclease/exonuclease/phosphatase family protein [Arcobacter sp. LA11]|uniref:endonuclease/exonuclease/phosphatase family protein n=1 Tax=Arcobacter sp. LA11 TaxID=1898176 RepID=UPI000933A513|nr:endonuclease/exonuclease/phosphatase family protein [Arcobacter sp. LA11]